MRNQMLISNDVFVRALAGCSVLTTCLAASAATSYDLTAGGALQLATPGYVVDFSTEAPAGGLFGSMYGLQGSGGVQEGYNASRWNGVNVMPDVVSSPSVTTDVTFNELGSYLAGGQNYSLFALTLNEPDLQPQPGQATLGTGGLAGNARISLDAFQVFIAETPLVNAISYTDLTSNARLVYDMSWDAFGGSEDRSILLNASAGGSGLYVSIPTQLFEDAAVSPSSYVYVYSKMGARPGFEAEGGFEQWAFLKAGGAMPQLLLTASVPETSTWVGGAAVMGLIGGAIWRRRSRSAR
jgi:hypothetical protein